MHEMKVAHQPQPHKGNRNDTQMRTRANRLVESGWDSSFKPPAGSVSSLDFAVLGLAEKPGSCKTGFSGMCWGSLVPSRLVSPTMEADRREGSCEISCEADRLKEKKLRYRPLKHDQQKPICTYILSFSLEAQNVPRIRDGL